MPLFADLDRLKAELDALRPLAPEQEQRVLQKFRLDWNYHSNAIEGNSLTLGETRSLLLHGLTAEGKPLRDHLDIKGHDEAVRGLEEIVHDDRPLTEQFIREMHQVLLGDEHYKPAYTATGQPTRQRIVPGQYKTSSNNVRTATGETFYFASPEETPARMNDLLIWYREEVEAPTLHPVALAAEFHHRFVSIHPFDDGNGRMSRLLMNLILMRHGYPITVIKADETTRNRYLAALSEADAGEPEPFLRFIIENVEASLRLMIRAAKGESIDEPDDLDKKLALLKKTLDREDSPEFGWNIQTKIKLYNSFLKPWLDNLLEQVSKFDFAFLEKSFSISLFDEGSPFPEEIELLKLTSLSESIAGIFINDRSFFNDFELTIKWKAFRQKFNDFDLSLSFDFTFGKASFKIQSRLYTPSQKDRKQTLELFELPYRNNYNYAQIHEINYQLANKVYDFIAAKLAEADTPPA
ncbi:Fic family protein [Hymenobacter cheonanensis]|uniref:Fic family protein n=1 Tax=Hymenobacter sp. CA2-7 TaxID=3063993 RepID=UPI002713192B|nr:Fic family protein [Hymenobacter sp. CA2-7]MDO7886887.1 Fic family protein [Hymenobacter sp. CA2-7]